MFTVGDIVMVRACENLDPVACRIIDMGPDENDTIWYMCEPIEFQAPAREFRVHCLTKIN